MGEPQESKLNEPYLKSAGKEIGTGRHAVDTLELAGGSPAPERIRGRGQGSEVRKNHIKQGRSAPG